MKVDEELDCVVVKSGQCVGCGAESSGRYCPECLDDVTTKKREEEASPAQMARAELARRELARRHLIPFIQRIKPEYMAGWFHKDLAARLERFVRRVELKLSPRMIINVPPRRGKSEQASKGLPAWVLGKHPDWTFIGATHSDDLAVDNSRDVQAYIKDEEYATLFPETELDPDNQGATGWRTTQGGRYKPVGMKKGVSGRGGHIVMIDDPHRDVDAYSPTVRGTVWQSYKSSLRTRLEPGGGIILIQTRWVLDDMTGRVIEEEGLLQDGGKWEQVVYPEEAEHDEYRTPGGLIVSLPGKDTTLLRKKGEVLNPERYTAKSNLEHKKDPITWQALFQQNPTAGDAAIFQEDSFKECTLSTMPPRDGVVFYSAWDTAVGQKDQHCNSVGATVGIDDEGEYWVYDLLIGKWDGFDLTETMIDNYFEFRQAMIGVEKTNHSVATESFFERRITERRAHGMATVLIPHGNKDLVMRSRPFQGLCKQGIVHVPTDAPWYPQFIQEMTQFPAAALDDIPAAFANLGQMLEEITAPHKSVPKHKKSWKDKVAAHGRRNRKNWRAA